MSVRFEAWRVLKNDWWRVADKIRQMYLKHHPLLHIARQALHERDLDTYQAMIRMFEPHICQFVLFDEGDTYLFKVVEQTHFFRQQAHQLVGESLYYNGVTGEGDHDLIALSDWADTQLQQHHYLMWTPITWTDVRRK